MKKMGYIPLFAGIKKITRIMKITAGLICILSMQVYAVTYGQTARITMEMNSSFRNVLEKIEDVSGYHFVLKLESGILDKIVSVKYNNEPIGEVLNDLLDGTGFSYKFIDKYIAITPSEGFSPVAQQQKISGTVTDKSGTPLLGVTVVIKGMNAGTITDVDGKFSFKNIPSDAILVFSFVGMKTLEVPFSGKISIDVIMEEEAIRIDEVVAIGYGTQRKSDLTGSISSISDESFKNYAVSNVTEVLAGKAAGVMVAAPSGQPGASAVVRIRGFSTVNDNNPLYVVDGQFMDNIQSLNPSDIEHVEILKDASATAIYGSRGSNGVILITTKNGKKGVTSINFDGYYGVNQNYLGLEMMNSEQYYNFILEGYKNDATFQNSQKQKFTNQYNKGYDTDWWKEVSQIGLNRNYNLSINKGTENYRSTFSAGLIQNEGTLITTKFDRLTLRFKQEYDLSNLVTVGANIALANMTSKDAGSVPAFDQIIKADPFTPVINPLVDPSASNYEYDKYAPTEWSYNPNPVQMLRVNDRSSKQFNVFGNIFASVKIFEDLTFRSQVSFEKNNTTFKLFTPIYASVFSPDMLGNRESKYNTDTKLTHNNNQAFNYITEQRLNYLKSFGKNRIDMMVASTYEKNDYEAINAYKTTALGNEEVYRVLDAQTKGPLTSGGRVSTSMLSYLLRANYSYADKYLATLSYRADGSSRFSESNRWGYFPAVSLGWRISKENFFTNLGVDSWLSSLKLRLGWGQNGNQRINANAPLTLIGTDTSKQWWFGNGYSQGYVPTYTGNNDLKWETSEQTNVGLDMVLFNNSLELTADVYLKRTKDMLLSMPIPLFGSYPNNPFFNAGDLNNKGFEITSNYRNKIRSSFNYHVGLIVSAYKTEVTGLVSEYLTGAASRTYEGGPIGRFWGYKVLGIFQTQTDVDNYKDKNGIKYQPNAAPGDFKFAKLGKEDIINDADDRTFIGDPNPDLIFGFNLGFDYRNFDFSMAWQGVVGNDIWNQSKGGYAIPGMQNSLAEVYTDSWRKEGDNTKYPRITTIQTNNNFRASSFYVEDGSYARLQNVQLGYTINQSKKLFSSLRLYVSGQNLLTLTGYSGLDPEIGVNSPLDQGVDNVRYPIYRSFVFGCNLQF